MGKIDGIRAYARYRKEKGLVGTSDAAVRKAIATGRINKRADGKLDFDECDKLWAKNTDPVMQAVPKAQNVKLVEKTGANPSANLGAHPDEELADHVADSIATLKLRELQLKVENLEIENAKKRGELVSKDNAVRIFNTIARQNRDGWLNWPNQIAAEMAADLGVDQHEYLTCLTRYVKINLTRITEMEIDVSPSTKL